MARHTDNVLLASKQGMATRFPVEELRIIKSRTSDGVRGMTLTDNDEVVSLCILGGNENDSELKDQFLSIDKELRLKFWQDGFDNLETKSLISELLKDEKYNKLSAEKIQSMIADEQLLLTITSDGMGKRSSAYEYRITGRGGKGISNINLQDKASVVMTSVADNEKEIIMITNKGQTTRIKASEIRLIGRNTKGVERW